MMYYDTSYGVNCELKNLEGNMKEKVISIFSILIDIYGVDKAIILLYMINKNRGVKNER